MKFKPIACLNAYYSRYIKILVNPFKDLPSLSFYYILLALINYIKKYFDKRCSIPSPEPSQDFQIFIINFNFSLYQYLQHFL